MMTSCVESQKSQFTASLMEAFESLIIQSIPFPRYITLYSVDPHSPFMKLYYFWSASELFWTFSRPHSSVRSLLYRKIQTQIRTTWCAIQTNILKLRAWMQWRYSDTFHACSVCKWYLQFPLLLGVFIVTRSNGNFNNSVVRDKTVTRCPKGVLRHILCQNVKNFHPQWLLAHCFRGRHIWNVGHLVRISNPRTNAFPSTRNI